MKKYVFLIILLLIITICSILGIVYYMQNQDDIKVKIIGSNEKTNLTNINENTDNTKKQETKSTLGTGMKRPANQKLFEEVYEINEYQKDKKRDIEYIVANLKNEELKNKINTFIKESKTKLESEKQNFKEYIETSNKQKKGYDISFEYDDNGNKILTKEEIAYCSPKLDNNYYSIETDNKKIKIITAWKCINGYLSIKVSYDYQYGNIMPSVSGERSRNRGSYKSYCATYDLYTGEQLQFSDLFFKGEDYSEELYEIMQDEIATYNMEDYIKRNFDILPADYQYFTIDSIIFNKENSYFSEGKILNIENSYTTFPLLAVNRDMKEIFNDKIEIKQYTSAKFRTRYINKKVGEIELPIPKITHWDKKVEEKINSNIEKYIEYIFDNGYMEGITKYSRYDPTDLKDMRITVRLENANCMSIVTEQGYLRYINFYINFTDGRLEKIKYGLGDWIGNMRGFTLNGIDIFKEQLEERGIIEPEEPKDRNNEEEYEKYIEKQEKYEEQRNEYIKEYLKEKGIIKPEEPEDRENEEKMVDYQAKINEYEDKIEEYVDQYLIEKGEIKSLDKAYEELKNL